MVPGVEVDEAAEGESGMGVDRIGEVDDRAIEGQAAGVNGAGFTTGSLARKGARDGRAEGEQGVDGGWEDGRR